MDRALIDAHLRHAAEAIGTPCYVYFLELIEERIEELQRAFQDLFSLSFAVKSNPNPALLGWLSSRIDQIDVSSIGELRLAQLAGWSADRASFTGPAKRPAEIREAIAVGVGELVIESVREAVLADRIAAEQDIVQDVVIRVAPDQVPRGFGDQMAGKPAAFGIDLETIDTELPTILSLANLRITGLHIYSGTQCLKPDAICQNYRTFIAAFRAISEAHDLCPAKLIFGSGLGIPYHDEDAPLDLFAVADGIAPDLAAMNALPCFADTRLVLELGRYLVGEAGYFVTEVVGTKQSRGTRIGICNGGMNNHLPASGHFGMVMRRNYSMHRVGGGDRQEKIDLVGPLCTSIDRLAIGAMLPRLEEGDLVAIHNSGAYGLTASPLHFISHALPHEVTVDAGIVRDVSRPLGDIV